MIESSPPPKPTPSFAPEKTPPMSNIPQRGLMAVAGTMSSLPVVNSLRQVAEAKRAGMPVDDANLQALLTQHFGSRLDIRVNHDYGDGAGGFEIIGFTVKLLKRDDSDKELIPALEYLNAPAKPEFLAGKIARMRVVMARRNESDKDIEMLIDTLVSMCREYPADAVAWAADHWMRTQKFFPLPKEFIDLLDERVRLRRALLAAIQCDVKALPKPAPAPMGFKELPRAAWNPAMWADFVADAEGMARIAKDNPMFDAAGWEAEVVKRKALRDAALGGTAAAPEAAAGVMASEGQNRCTSV